MLDISKKNLVAEVVAAEKNRDKYIAGLDSAMKKMCGQSFRQDWAGEKYYPENTFFEYISLVLPMLCYANPRWSVDTPLNGPQYMVAQALRLGMNKLTQDQRLVYMLQKIAVDALFRYGVTVVKLKRVNGVLKPFAERLSSDKFFWDPVTTDETRLRYMGNRWRIDKDDLVKVANEQDGWDKKAVAEFTTFNDEKRGKDVPDRKECEPADVWIPELQLDGYRKEDGWFGAVVTIATSDQGGVILRAPRPFYGSGRGPYQLHGIYPVSDEPTRLGPLCAVDKSIDDLNSHAMAVTDSARKYKRMLVIDDKLRRLEELVRRGKHDGVYGVPGFDKTRAEAFEIFGITPQMIEWNSLLRERQDRNLGMSDALRGNVTGDATASENLIAEKASTGRLGYVQQQFERGVSEIGYAFAHYLYYDNEVAFPLGQEAADELMHKEPWFHGGDHDPASGYTLDDLMLSIEPGSMERSDDGAKQQSKLGAVTWVTNVAPMIPQTPYIKWGELFAMAGDAFNESHLPRVLDEKIAAQVTQDMQEQGQPRLMSDLGRRAPSFKGASKPPINVTMGATPKAPMKPLEPKPTAKPKQPTGAK